MININSKINLFSEIIYDNQTALNIFSKYKIFSNYNTNLKFYIEYIVAENDRWDLIAHKIYRSYNLWWVIAMLNNIKNPFEELQTGQILKVIDPSYLPEIMIQIRKAQQTK